MELPVGSREGCLLGWPEGVEGREEGCMEGTLDGCYEREGN